MCDLWFFVPITTQGPALIQIEHFNQVSMIVPKGRARKDDET